MEKHTPTPWRLSSSGFPVDSKDSSIPIETGFIGVARVQEEEAQANAAFIVRAVNSHEALILALQTIVELNMGHVCEFHGAIICDKCQALTDAGKALTLAGAQ